MLREKYIDVTAVQRALNHHIPPHPEQGWQHVTCTTAGPATANVYLTTCDGQQRLKPAYLESVSGRGHINSLRL